MADGGANAPAARPAAVDAKAARKLGETEREVHTLDPEFNLQRAKHYHAALDNHIVTSKYNVVTFLPRNLFEQFTRVANAYFLVLLILQLIPQISSLSPVTTAVPLIFVLAVTAIKDGFDDYKRHKSDRLVNSRKTKVMRNGRWEEITWANVVVGDFIKLDNDQPVPADMVIIATNDESGECFVETADLDGETNLKPRRALPRTKELRNDSDLKNLKFKIVCEPPNNKLHKFIGTMFFGAEGIPLSNDELLLRGCIIRNSHWVTGVVVFAGSDTKLMQNSGAARFKRTHIDKMMNKLVFTIFVILFIFCTIAAVLNSIWEHDTGDGFQIYLWREDVTNPDLIAFLQFFSYIIVLNTLVPISLYVSIEIIRLGQSFLIDWDVNMYHPDTNTPAQARTTTLNEELGQIDYIFSDKTGTLTQNVMNFLQCSVQGKIYGKEADMTKQTYDGFIDDRLQNALNQREEGVCAFFRLLSLCHTVQPELVEDKVVYQAESPDEKALVEAARDAGFVFEKRTSEDVFITEFGKRQHYKLLYVLEFNSTRKRMSSILRTPQGKIIIYTKGADNIMFERLSEESKRKDMPALVDHLHAFAKDGLRTLVLGQRELSEDFWNDWSRRMNDAETGTTNEKEREEAISRVAAEVESGLSLVGASAIEDKLQYRVPDTIANLKAGNIKVWVLTGDKQETAINIGASCRLLTSEMEPLFIVNGDSYEAVLGQLSLYRDTLKKETKRKSHGLVIDGPSLVFPLPPEASELKKYERDENGNEIKKWTPEKLAIQKKLEDAFVEVSRECNAVVCCRVSPLQKSQVVRLIKTREKAITLAIGDGANDVSMIKAAHVGVGISGLEGRQAVLASDYSIAQFRFLERLLLVHGRWSYMRMCAFLNYFFYKNFAFTVVQFWFAFLCAYSAQTIYDAVFIALYNVVFTSLPILAVGMFEQDVGDLHSVDHPHLYEAGPRNLLFSRKFFFKSLLLGGLHSLILFLCTLLAYRLSGDIDKHGLQQGDLLSFGAGLTVILVFIVNMQLALEIRHWNWIIWVTILIGPITWFVMFGGLYNWSDTAFVYTSDYYGVFNRIMSNGTFWVTFFLTLVLTILPSLLYKYYHLQINPTPIDIVRERLFVLNKNMNPERGNIPRTSPTNRSSFAFSAEEHHGRRLSNVVAPTHKNQKREVDVDTGMENDALQAGTVPVEVNMV